MNLKKIKIIAVFLTFLIAFPIHFIYDLFPNPIISIFIPVNESIWEHMKILFTVQILYSIIDYKLIKHYNIKINNFKFNIFFTSFISIPIYLLLYLPLYFIFKENMFISISLILIVFAITQYISYKILTSKNNSKLNFISIPLIILCYIIFTILTYYPPHNFLFYDTANKLYGIKK